MIATWYLWLLAALVLGILEFFVSGFFVMAFAVGCLAAALTAAAGLALQLQLLAFGAGTLAAFALARPFLLRVLAPAGSTPTNVQALLGRRGVVSQPIDTRSQDGRVVVDGEDWRAVSREADTLPPGTAVRVVAVEGTRLVVVRSPEGDR